MAARSSHRSNRTSKSRQSGPRPLWSGRLRFGLVEIPVRLHSAEAPGRELDFDLVDRRDHEPVGFRRINKKTGEEIEPTDLVKVLKIPATGQEVTFTDEELRALRVRGSGEIEIESFVSAEEIDWRYFERPYYLVPKDEESKSYSLLREALERSAKVGLAKVVLHNRQHLAMVASREGALVLEIMRFPQELRGPDELGLSTAEKSAVKTQGLSEKEIGMAEKLIEQMTEEWDPDRFHDTYFEEVMNEAMEKARHPEKPLKLVEEKEEEEEPSSSIIRLAPLLEESLRQKRNARERRSPK